MVTVFIAVIAIGLLVYAALHDLAARTVPNWLALSVFVVGLGARIADHSLRPGLAAAAVTFAVLFTIWMLSAMGGGDVKLWSATSLLVPPGWQNELGFVLHVLLLGGLLALVYLGLSLILPKTKPQAGMLLAGRPFIQKSFVKRVLRAEMWRIGRRAPLPYACAISGSAIVSLLPFSFQH